MFRESGGPDPGGSGLGLSSCSPVAEAGTTIKIEMVVPPAHPLVKIPLRKAVSNLNPLDSNPVPILKLLLGIVSAHIVAVPSG